MAHLSYNGFFHDTDHEEKQYTPHQRGFFLIPTIDFTAVPPAPTLATSSPCLRSITTPNHRLLHSIHVNRPGLIFSIDSDYTLT